MCPLFRPDSLRSPSVDYRVDAPMRDVMNEQQNNNRCMGITKNNNRCMGITLKGLNVPNNNAGVRELLLNHTMNEEFPSLIAHH